MKPDDERGQAVARMQVPNLDDKLKGVKVNSFNMQHTRDAVVYSLAKHGPGRKLSEHFRLIEFACKDGSDIVIVHPAVVLAAEAIRRHFGVPLRVNSAFRTKEYNGRIEGKPSSRHLVGMAMDIAVHEVDAQAVADFAESLGMGGIGRYRTFTHIDVQGQGRRW